MSYIFIKKQQRSENIFFNVTCNNSKNYNLLRGNQAKYVQDLT